MKSLIFLLIYLAILIPQKASADIVPGLNRVYLKHGWLSQQTGNKILTYTNPYTQIQETRYVGSFTNCFISQQSIDTGQGAIVSALYSLHINDQIIMGDTCYKDVGLVQDIHIYKALKSYSYKGAPLQIIIWHYNDGLDINSVLDSSVRLKALALKDSIENGYYYIPYFPMQYLRILSAQEPDQFTLDYSYALVLNNIQLSISDGELSDSIVSYHYLDPPIITVTGVSNGTTIRAIAEYNPMAARITPGTIFYCLSGGEVAMSLGERGYVSAQITWGVLPINLTSFTSIVDANIVRLNWTTSSERNNSEFQIERKSEGDWQTIGYVEGHGTTSFPHMYQFIDRNIQSGKYSYRLMQIDYNGNFEYHNLSNEVVIGIPEKFELKQNYPNPFNPKTRIEYTVPNNGIVTLIVYDINGREISSLVKESKPAGYYSVDFDGSNLSSGIYYYRLVAGNYKVTKRMMLIK